MKSAPPQNVDDYIQGFPADVQRILSTLRLAIRQVFPAAEESISYGIPTYKLGKSPVVYFAAHQHHVSIYPATERSVVALPRLAPYRSGRGTLKFPLDKPVPLALVKQFVRLRLKEELTRARTVKPVSRKSPSNQSTAQQQLAEGWRTGLLSRATTHYTSRCSQPAATTAGAPSPAPAALPGPLPRAHVGRDDEG